MIFLLKCFSKFITIRSSYYSGIFPRLNQFIDSISLRMSPITVQDQASTNQIQRKFSCER